MSTFICTYAAEAQSTNVVKLIRNGRVFADSLDVYTMVWNSGTKVYEASLDDTTIVEDYYRIEDGSANVVIKDFPIHAKTLSAASIPDKFVKNDADDAIIGELAIKPASATDTQLRVGNESATVIRVSAENASSSADRKLELQANEIALRTGAAAAIKITNLAAGSASADAVNFAQLDALKGSGWTSGMTLKAHDDRLNNLEGSGTFSAASISLTATSNPSGVGLSWGMNTSGNEDAVRRYEVYLSVNQLGGYAGPGALNSVQYGWVRANMQRVSLSGLRDRTAFVATTNNCYFIVLAFDHNSPETCYGSSQVNAGPSNALDGAVPLIGNASMLSGLSALAGIVDSLKKSVGGGAMPKVLYSQFSAATTATGTPAAILVYTETGASYTKRAIQTVWKDSVFKTLRLRARFKSSSGSESAYIKLTCGGLSIETSTKQTAYQDLTLDLDLSSLTDGEYEADVQMYATGGATNSFTNYEFQLLSA